MHRIDDPTAIAVMPAPRPAGTPGYFSGGSPGSGGFAATVVRYEWMNAVQEELAAIVAAAGVPLDKTNNHQVIQALSQMLRFKLTQNQTLYVSPTGNDANDGLSAATPLATGQAAWLKALTLDLNNHSLTIQFAPGTYTAQMTLAGAPLGIGTGNGIIIQGDMVQPSNVVFSVTNASCVYAINGANVRVQGVRLKAQGTSGPYQGFGTGLLAGQGGTITFSNIIFDQCDSAHFSAMTGGQIQSDGNPYTIVAGGAAHMSASIDGFVANVNSAVSVTGNPAFTTAFAFASSQGKISSNGCAYAGAATGHRYLANQGGMIFTGGSGAGYFPGDTAGTVDPSTFGLYL